MALLSDLLNIAGNNRCTLENARGDRFRPLAACTDEMTRACNGVEHLTCYIRIRARMASGFTLSDVRFEIASVFFGGDGQCPGDQKATAKHFH